MAALIIPEQVLAGEIEFAVAYIRACNPARDLTGEDRELLAAAIAALLLERAGGGLSGMYLEDVIAKRV